MKLESKPFTLIVLQPTSFCNIQCDYCYLSITDRNSKGIMSDTVLEKSIETIFRSELIANTDKTRIVWHSGEPLTVPISFYENAVNITNKYKPNHLTVSQQIITNAILLNKNWCDFFLKNDIEVVVSIDGPEFIHDLNRKYRNQKGTYKKVIQGIKVLKDNGVRFSVLTTITNNTLKYAEQLFSFYKENNLNEVGFNFEEVSAFNEHSSLSNNLTNEIYSFIKTLYKLYSADNSIQIREFEKVKNYILFGDLYEVQYDTLTPLSNITIDKNGNFSTFASELLGMKHERYCDFSFGNVLTDNLLLMKNNEKLIELHNEILNGVEMCRNTCEFFEICGSSKPDAKLSANGSVPNKGRFDVTESFHCKVTIKMIGNIIFENIKEQYEASN